MIGGRSFYDQPINDLIKMHEVRKVSAEQGDGYFTGCLLDYAYLKNYTLVAVNLSKQKALDADPREI